jgi:hypothetical protein
MKCMYQARKVIGHVFVHWVYRFWLFLRFVLLNFGTVLTVWYILFPLELGSFLTVWYILFFPRIGIFSDSVVYFVFPRIGIFSDSVVYFVFPRIGIFSDSVVYFGFPLITDALLEPCRHNIIDNAWNWRQIISGNLILFDIVRRVWRYQRGNQNP